MIRYKYSRALNAFVYFDVFDGWYCITESRFDYDFARTNALLNGDCE